MQTKRITKDELIQFARNNFYVLSHLSSLYYPIIKCRPNRRIDWNKYTIELIFSKSRYMRLCYSRYLLMYVMSKNGYIQKYICTLFDYTDASAWCGINVIKNYLKRYASCDEIILINELAEDFKKKLCLI